MTDTQSAYQPLARRLADGGHDVAAIERALAAFAVETPSWGYGDSGTRFGVFPQPGRPRDVFEKIDDAAEVHRLTGTAPAVALHFPWDAVDEPRRAASHIAESGLRVGAVNPNLFQDPDYKLGSITNPDPAIRRKAIEHLLECVQIAAELGSTAQSLWLADGTNYAGQDDLRARRDRLADSLAELYARPARRPGAARRVQVLRARLLRHRHRRLGLGAAPLPGARRRGRGCWSTSATTPRGSTSSRSSPSWRARTGSAAFTSTTASTPTTT